jgi:hypothetical protein
MRKWNRCTQANNLIRELSIKSDRPGALLLNKKGSPRPFEEAIHFLVFVLIPTVAQIGEIKCKSPSVEIPRASSIGTADE